MNKEATARGQELAKSGVGSALTSLKAHYQLGLALLQSVDSAAKAESVFFARYCSLNPNHITHWRPPEKNGIAVGRKSGPNGACSEFENAADWPPGWLSSIAG